MRHATVTLMRALRIHGKVGAEVTGHSSQPVSASYAVMNAEIQRAALRKHRSTFEAAATARKVLCTFPLSRSKVPSALTCAYASVP
jgi:hypothetical protein